MDLPICVMLVLIIGLVSNSHGTHAAISRQVCRNGLFELRFAKQSIERLDTSAFCVIDNVA